MCYKDSHLFSKQFGSEPDEMQRLTIDGSTKLKVKFNCITNWTAYPGFQIWERNNIFETFNYIQLHTTTYLKLFFKKKNNFSNISNYLHIVLFSHNKGQDSKYSTLYLCKKIV